MKQIDQRAKMAILDTLLSVGIAIVVVGLFIAFGADVVTDVGADFTANSYADNATDDALSGMSKLSAKLPSIGSIGGIIVIIGLLLSAFAVGGRRFN